MNSSKGNIVLTLSDQNAARMVLDLVSTLPKAVLGESHERAAEKEKEFYAAVFDYKPEVSQWKDILSCVDTKLIAFVLFRFRSTCLQHVMFHLLCLAILREARSRSTRKKRSEMATMLR